MKFSIIIPCYKVEKYIRECLDSVLGQSYDNWEAICTDDGSPDNTGSILDEYAQRDYRIKVVHQPNSGLSAARNAALERATGEWLYYLDGDDVMAPRALETYDKMAGLYPRSDLLCAGMLSFKDGETVIWQEIAFVAEGYDVSNAIKARFLSGYFTTFLYRRSKFGDILFFGMSWCEERPYFAKCLARAQFIAVTNVPCYGFRTRSESITHRKMSIAEFNGYLDATRSVKDSFVMSGKYIENNARRYIYLTWTETQCAFMFRYFFGEDRATAFGYWIRSLDELLRFGGSTAWFWFSVRLMRIVPSQLVAFVLFCFPNWLKGMGVHR